VKKDFEEIDVSPGVAMAMSVKDDDEQVPNPASLLIACRLWDIEG